MTAVTFLPEDSSCKFTDVENATSLEHTLPVTVSTAEVEVVSKDRTGNTSGACESLAAFLISVETVQKAEDIARYTTNALVVVGIFLCLFSIVVYASKQMRSPNSIYMVALNLTELICVVILMIKEITVLIYGDEVFTKLVYVLVVIYLDTFGATAIRRTKYWVTCLLSAERCIAILLPLKSKHYKIIRYPLLTIMFVTILTLLDHSFILLQLIPTSFQSTPTNETIWKIGLTDFYVADRSWLSVCEIVSLVLFVLLPLSGCLIFNSITTIALHRHNKNRNTIIKDNQVSSRSTNDSRTTTVVLVATMVLVISALPANIPAILKKIYPELLAKCRHLLVFIWNMGRITELINNCLGFVFYMTISSRFRKSFLEIFFSKCRGTPGSKNDLISSDTRQNVTSQRST